MVVAAAAGHHGSVAEDAAALRQGHAGLEGLVQVDEEAEEDDSGDDLDDSSEDEEPPPPPPPPPVYLKLYAVPRDYQRAVEINVELYKFHHEPHEDQVNHHGHMNVIQTESKQVKCTGTGPDYGANSGSKFVCSCAATDFAKKEEKVYCVPYDARKVLEINLNKNTVEEVGKTFRKEGGKYADAICSTNRDGRMYAAPCRAQRLLEIDATAGTIKELGKILGTGQMNKWWGIFPSCRGRIYAIPYDAHRVLEIDPQRGGTTRLVGPDLGPMPGKYCCCCEAPNGNLYCAPLNASRVLEIDMDGKVRLTGPDLGEQERKYACIIQAPNKLLYAPPLYADYVLEINCARGDVKECGEGMVGGEAKYCCGAVANNGKIYCPPLEARKVLEIDCEYHDCNYIGMDLGGGEIEKYSSICAVPGNEKLYAAPRSAHYFLEINSRRSYVREVGHDYGRCIRKFCSIHAGALWQGGMLVADYVESKRAEAEAYRHKMENFERRATMHRLSVAADQKMHGKDFKRKSSSCMVSRTASMENSRAPSKAPEASRTSTPSKDNRSSSKAH